MLQTIREKLTGWFAVFILGAIALTLVVTFGNIDTGFSATSAAATVNGEDITVREFRQIYQRQRQQWESNYRTQMPDSLAQDMGDSVIQSLVRNRAVGQHVRDAGYRINDDDVISAITSNEAFYVGGKFSQPAYEQLLGSQGLSTQRFEFETRRAMETGQFIEGIGYTAFFTPAEFRRYIELDGETRDLNYTILSASNWADKVQLTDEQIQSYYEMNSAQFQTQESVALSYIEVDIAAITESVTVDVDEARVYYEANPDEFQGPDERNASHILIAFGDDEAAAAILVEEVYERLLAGESFDELAAQFSVDTGTAGNGGDLGWLGSGDSPAAEFEEALFALGENDVSKPVRTEYGFHLIRLDGIRAGNALEFAEVSEFLVQRLRDDAAADRYGDLLDELDERALESLDGLEPVAEAMGVELKRIAAFTRSGGLPLGYNPQLVDTVFSLEVLEDGENSPVIELSEGRAIVVQVTEHQLPVLLPLAEVRDSIVNQLTNNEAIILAGQAGDKLYKDLNAGAEPNASAQALNLEWQRSEEVRRSATDLPADLAAAVFRAPKPIDDAAPVYTGLMLASGDFAVYRVLAVNPGRPDSYSVEERDSTKQRLTGRLGGGQATAVVESLVEQASVQVVPDLVGSQSDQL